MSNPPLATERISYEHAVAGALQQGQSADQREVPFVYTGQPKEEIPRNITNLLVDPSVRRIEDEAFKNCRELRTVTIPPTVEVIGDKAFFGCVSLTDVRLHEGLKKIGISSFQNCISLKEVDIPHGITKIAQNSFGGCKSLHTVSMPTTLTVISFGAFAGCVSLVDVFLPEGLKRIDIRGFGGCTGLSSVVFPSSLDIIGYGAFLSCENLQCVEFPPNAKAQLGMSCFFPCKSLVNLSIPKSMPGVFMGDRYRERFSNHPVHSLCYNSSHATREQLVGVLDGINILDESLLKDEFGMTPFHIVASSASLNLEILECLLERYPMAVLLDKDGFGNTTMDYLLKHTSPRAVPLLQMALKVAITHTVSTWHPQEEQWRNNLSSLAESIPLNSDMDMRRQCVKDFFGLVGYCCQMEMTSLLELAVWKKKLQLIQELGESSDDDGDNEISRRDSCRYQSGAGVVIDNVSQFLWDGKARSDTGLSLFPLCSSASLERLEQK